MLADEGAVVAVNSVVAVVDESGSAAVAAQPAAASAAPAPSAPVATTPAQSTPPPSSQTETQAVSDDAKGVKSSPLVRKMAAEHNIDLNKVTGSGEGGRINKQDLVSYMEAAKGTGSGLVASAAQSAFSAVKTASGAAVDSTGGLIAGTSDGVRVERVPMTQMRKKIAEHMVMSKRTSPHVTSVIEIDLQKIVDLRAKFKDKFESLNGFKLSFMPFFMHAALEAIKAVPIVNASVDGDTIVYKKDVNLGIAVALDWGLIVPVIKNST